MEHGIISKETEAVVSLVSTYMYNFLTTVGQLLELWVFGLQLQLILPGGYKGKVLGTEKFGNGFSCILRVNLNTKQEALPWLNDF